MCDMDKVNMFEYFGITSVHFKGVAKIKKHKISTSSLPSRLWSLYQGSSVYTELYINYIYTFYQINILLKLYKSSIFEILLLRVNISGVITMDESRFIMLVYNSTMIL